MKNLLSNQMPKITLVSAMLAALVTTATVNAYQGQTDDGFDAPFSQEYQGMHKRHHHKMMAKYLGLTDEQKQQMQTIRQQAKAQASEIKTNLSEYKTKVKAIVQATEFDQAAFENLHAEYQQSFSQLALLRAKTKHAMHQVMTEEQRAKFIEMKSERRRR